MNAQKFTQKSLEAIQEAQHLSLIHILSEPHSKFLSKPLLLFPPLLEVSIEERKKQIVDLQEKEVLPAFACRKGKIGHYLPIHVRNVCRVSHKHLLYQAWRTLCRLKIIDKGE